MKTPRRKNGIWALALVLCVCLAVVLVGSALFLSTHDSHHCHDAHCKVCHHLQQARQTLGQLLFGGFTSVLALFAAASTALPLFWAGPGRRAASPVRCHVRMDQ